MPTDNVIMKVKVMFRRTAARLKMSFQASFFLEMRNCTIGPFGMGNTVAVIVLHHVAVVMLTGRRRLVGVMAPAPEQQAQAAAKQFFAANHDGLWHR